MSLFEVDDAKCNRCRMCVLECPAGIISMSSPKALPSPTEGGEGRCITCGHCVAVCAPAAFSHRAMRPEDLVPVSRRQLPTAAQAERFLKSRRSIRVYKKKPVPKEALAKLIGIASYAPSGMNVQPAQWLVVEDPKEVKRLAGLVVDWICVALEAAPEIAASLRFDLMVKAWDMGIDVVLRGAPHVIVVHAHRDLPLADKNCSIALTYLELAAYSLGLGACWAGWFQAAAAGYPPLTEALQLPEGHQSFGAMMVGYPKYRYSRIPLRNEPAIIWR